TGMNTEVFSDKRYEESIVQGIPLGRLATADDVALAIVFLASDWARHITGEILNVNGGAVLCG
ncbi:MAG TPA: SDR family oxidoreductase, partial [Pyrinomonadaceae bacterium]|nr:SDR family oxidoreductase [Pyrinomonadaceae bacterium]